MQRVVVTLVAALVAAAPLTGQEPWPLLSRDVALADFGVDSAAGVRRGRVSVVLAPEGPRLDVQYLFGVASATAPATEPIRPPAEPVPAGPPLDAGPEAAPPTTTPLAALWVWSTEELLSDTTARDAFLDFVQRRGIDRVFLQLIPSAGATSNAGFVPFDGALVGPLVAELRRRGALTYALDGDARYVHPENHAGVLRTVARVAEHNRDVPAEQRFYGVRYDVEPYLLPGFQGPRRAQLFADYLRLLGAVSESARASDLVVGVDIPFWLDTLDEVTGQPFEAELGGVRAPVLGRVLDLADDVAVMAYRTFADGPDGVLEHTRGELARAASEGAGVFVGIETTPHPDEQRFTFGGSGRRGLPSAPDVPWVVLEERRDGSARVWLAQGSQALSALGQSTRDAVSLRHWFAGTPVPLPGSVLSFHALGPEAMRRVADEVLDGLGSDASFRGIAYHDYRGLRALLDAP